MGMDGYPKKSGKLGMCIDVYLKKSSKLGSGASV